MYPSIGNHDTAETEERDDRAQVEDNFYLRERIAGEEAAGRASFCPGSSTSSAMGPASSSFAWTRRRRDFSGAPAVRIPQTLGWVERRFRSDRRRSGEFRLPTIRLSAQARSITTPEAMERLVPLFQRSGVQAMFSGHEHNFQHSRADGIEYFVTGGAEKLRRTPPDNFAAAHTVSWATQCHFLLARIERDQMLVRAIGELETPAAAPIDLIESMRTARRLRDQYRCDANDDHGTTKGTKLIEDHEENHFVVALWYGDNLADHAVGFAVEVELACGVHA